jgi:hypothetical protein
VDQATHPKKDLISQQFPQFMLWRQLAIMSVGGVEVSLHGFGQTQLSRNRTCQALLRVTVHTILASGVNRGFFVFCYKPTPAPGLCRNCQQNHFLSPIANHPDPSLLSIRKPLVNRKERDGGWWCLPKKRCQPRPRETWCALKERYDHCHEKACGVVRQNQNNGFK